MIDEDHQEILNEITRCKEHLAKIQEMNDQLDKLEEKKDYIKILPEKKEEKLTKLVEKIKEKEKHILLPKTTERYVKSNVFKPLEKPLHDSTSMPDFEQSTSLTKITFEKPKVLKGTREIK